MATFRKRGDRWQVQVRRQGVFESATFDTKAAAQKWARRIEGEIDQGSALGRERVTGTVGELLDAYEVAARKIRPFGRSKLGVLKQLRDGLGHVPLRTLTSDVILAHCRRRRERGAGPVTVGLDLSMLGTILRSAHALVGRRLSDDPVRQARAALRPAGMIGKSRERERVATGEEIERLAVHFAGSSYPISDFLRFSAITGMRREEIARLRWEDLDEARGLVVVRDRKDPRRKAGNDQAVPLLFGSLEIVRRQPRNGPLIFPLRPETVTTMFPRACRAQGIVGLRLHDLRHTAITRMFEAGMSLEEVALVSGHRTWAQLKRYTHLKPAWVARKYLDARPNVAGPDAADDGLTDAEVPSEN